MAKYSSNEQYERGKSKIIRLAENFACIKPFLRDRDVIARLLKQSKWIDAVDVTTFDDGSKDSEGN